MSLYGALASSGSPDVAACPDEISTFVARYYALTEDGRLFHWRYGEIREIQASSGHARRDLFRITVRGTEWWVGRRELLDRLFPDRALDVEEIDWSTYDPNKPIEGMEDDPLRDKGCIKRDGAIVPRCLGPDDGGPTEYDLDRADRLFYGE